MRDPSSLTMFLFQVLNSGIGNCSEYANTTGVEKVKEAAAVGATMTTTTTITARIDNTHFPSPLFRAVFRKAQAEPFVTSIILLPPGFQFGGLSDLEVAAMYKERGIRDGAIYYLGRARLSVVKKLCAAQPSDRVTTVYHTADYISEYANMLECVHKEYEEAAILYRSILKHAPNHVKTLQRLGWSIYQDESDSVNSRNSEAFELLQRSLELDDTDFRTWYFLAHYYYWVENDTVASLKHTNASLALSDNEANIWLLSALCHVKEELYMEAEDHFRKAISLHPGNAQIWLDYGQYLEDQDFLYEAICAYKKALFLEPSWDTVRSYVNFLCSKPMANNLF